MWLLVVLMTIQKLQEKELKNLKKVAVKSLLVVLEKECKKHHKRFFTFHNKKRPFIILKWAETIRWFYCAKK